MTTRPSSTNQHALTFIPKTDGVVSDPAHPRESVRWIYPPDAQGWTGFVLSEWSLERVGTADRHTHTETNVVVEGELHVECQGEVVVARAGDTVTIPAGQTGRYWAPDYARMIAVYGPNPDGTPPDSVEYWDL